MIISSLITFVIKAMHQWPKFARYAVPDRRARDCYIAGGKLQELRHFLPSVRIRKQPEHFGQDYKKIQLLNWQQ